MPNTAFTFDSSVALTALLPLIQIQALVNLCYENRVGRDPKVPPRILKLF